MFEEKNPPRAQIFRCLRIESRNKNCINRLKMHNSLTSVVYMYRAKRLNSPFLVVLYQFSGSTMTLKIDELDFNLFQSDLVCYNHSCSVIPHRLSENRKQETKYWTNAIAIFRLIYCATKSR